MKYQASRAINLSDYRLLRQVLLQELAIRKHGAGEEWAKNRQAYRVGLATVRHAYHVLYKGDAS